MSRHYSPEQILIRRNNYKTNKLDKCEITVRSEKTIEKGDMVLVNGHTNSLRWEHV